MKTDDVNKLLFIQKQKIEQATLKFKDELVNDIVKSAQRNFNRFREEVPADDPNVYVMRRDFDKYHSEVVCSGNQVLFIEFGAGIEHSTETSTIGYVEVAGVGKVEMEVNKIRYFSNYDTNMRPTINGPYPNNQIGGYGKGRGNDPSWVYNGTRESLHGHSLGPNKSGVNRIRTSGNRPARALYRAIRSSLRRRIVRK